MFNRKKKRIAELEEELARAVTAKDKFYDKLIQEWKRNTKLADDAKELEKNYGFVCRARDYWCDLVREKADKMHELEEKLKNVEEDLDVMHRQRNLYFDQAAKAEDSNEDLKEENEALEKKVHDLEEKLKNVELELEQTKKSSDHWYNQFEHISGECTAYAAISKKFMAVHEDGDVDDTCIIHNGKVYTIIGVKHIVDNLGDTLDIRAELIDPEKEEKSKIGFKAEEEKEDK